MNRPALAVACAALLAAIATGCTTHPAADPVPAPTRAGSIGADIHPTPPTPTMSTPTPATQGTRPPPPSACTSVDLSLAQLPGSSSAAGTVIIAIGLSNTSSRACALDGYPDFTLTGDPNPAVTVQHGGPGPTGFDTPPTARSLPAGEHLGFLLAYANRPPAGQTTCGHATKMHLNLPTGTTTGPVDIAVCGQPMRVSPYLPPDQLSIG